MNKKKYIKPRIEIITMTQNTTILAGSQDNWADAKKKKQDTNLWDDEDEENNNSSNGYDPYHGW